MTLKDIASCFWESRFCFSAGQVYLETILGFFLIYELVFNLHNPVENSQKVAVMNFRIDKISYAPLSEDGIISKEKAEIPDKFWKPTQS